MELYVKGGGRKERNRGGGEKREKMEGWRESWDARRKKSEPKKRIDLDSPLFKKKKGERLLAGKNDALFSFLPSSASASSQGH